MSDGLTPRQRLEQARARRLQAEDARQGYRRPPTPPPPERDIDLVRAQRIATQATQQGFVRPSTLRNPPRDIDHVRAQQAQQNVGRYRQQQAVEQATALDAFKRGEAAAFGDAESAAQHSSLVEFRQNLAALRETRRTTAEYFDMITAMEAQGLDPATEGAVDAFLNFVVAEGYADEDDRDYLAVLEELVRLTIGQGENWDAQNALRLLLESGALDGRGFSATTLDYLTGDFNYQWSDDEMGQLEALQQFLAGELENFIEQGLIGEEALPYVSDALIDQRNVGVLMALYQEALEQMSSEQRAAYPDYDYLSTTAPQFFFASQTEDLYPEDTTPYGEMLLFTMSFFPGLDQVASGIDFFRSLAAGDVAGAILSGLDFVTPGSVRAIGNALGYSDEALGIIGRNAGEAMAGIQRGYPLGFDDYEEFLEFGNVLQEGFRSAGYDDMTAVFVGSSVTNRGFNSGLPFDEGRVSDFDIAIVDPVLLSRIQELGLKTPQGTHTTALHFETPEGRAILEELGLYNLAVELSEMAGRPVHFMIYDSVDTVNSRTPPIIVVPSLDS
jgi:hypothetical protein